MPTRTESFASTRAHCCILLLSHDVAMRFAIWRKRFRWRVQHCRLSLRKVAGFAFFFWVCLHCCILLFLPDATPCGSFFTRVKQGKPAEKEKPARKNLPCENEDWQPCFVAFFLFCPVSSPVNALCRILLPKGDIYPSDWNQGCNARFEARKKSAFYFCAELVDNASESIVSVFRKAILS